MSVDLRCATLAVLCALSVCVATPAHAQQQPAAPARGAHAAPPPAPQEAGPGDAQARDAAARDAADRLHGAGGTEESLLGAPAPLDDPYRAAFDSTDRRITKLMNSELVPRGALHQDVYGGQAAGGRAPRLQMGLNAPQRNAPNGGNAGLAATAGTGVNGNGPALTPENTAQGIYRGAVGAKPAGNANGTQIYRMPW